MQWFKTQKQLERIVGAKVYLSSYLVGNILDGVVMEGKNKARVWELFDSYGDTEVFNIYKNFRWYTVGIQMIVERGE